MAAHWYVEKTIACELIGRTLCCLPCTYCGLRTSYPSDYWFKPSEVTRYRVLRAADDYAGLDKKLSREYLVQRVEEAVGSTGRCCIGVCSCSETHEIVRSCEVGTDGRLTLLIIPGMERRVNEGLSHLQDRLGLPIEVEGLVDDVVRSQPTASGDLKRQTSQI